MCVCDGECVWCEVLAFVLGPFVFHTPLSQVHPSIVLSVWLWLLIASRVFVWKMFESYLMQPRF